MLEHEFLTYGKDIEAMLPYWDKVEAIVEGHDAVKSLTIKFLPKFVDETDKEYDFRLEHTKFTNIYRDTLEGLATKPFEAEVSVLGDDKRPDAVVKFCEDVDGAGNNLTMFSALTFFSGINEAINWIFVDYPTIDNAIPMSLSEAKNKGIRPFWSHVLARNVREVKSEVVNSKEIITYIRIFEPSVEKGKMDKVRIFQRSPDNVVTWELWEKVEKFTKVEDSFTKINGGTLSIGVIPLVPFITGRRDGRSYKFSPVMRDACDLQVTLYRNESALEFIKIMAGYPMLAANGMKPEKEADGKTNKKISIGPRTVLYAAPDGSGNHGTWSYVEPNANSMEFLQKNIDKTKQDLRELGRQPLTALSSQLTTVTTSIAAGKARSAVTAWALALKDALENAFKITMMYMKENFEPEVFVYTGFDNLTDNATDLDALASARDRGDLSQETYLSELQRRKVLSPEFNFEQEKERLLAETPSDNPNPAEAQI